MSQDYQTRWLNTEDDKVLEPSVRAITRTLTLATLANSSHNSRIPRVHPPSRDTTPEMSFQATTQGMSRVFPLSRATT